MKEFFTSEAVTDAEILWVLNLVIYKYSINSCRHINELLAAMFKDSKIAQSFSCGNTKCSYIINFEIASHFQSLLQESLTEARYLAPCFDESYNSTIKKKQMDMHIRFWDAIKNQVSIRYYNMEFLKKQQLLTYSRSLKTSSFFPTIFSLFKKFLLQKCKKPPQIYSILLLFQK